MDGIKGYEIRPEGMTEKFGLTKKPIPLEVNTSQDYFERERDAIYRSAWVNVGRVEDIPKTGDWLVQDIPALDTSIVVVRGRDGVIRAFHNMCQHRGNKVVHAGEECGQGAKGFSCTFHGWTYDLTGKLVIVPDEDQFFNLDKSKRGLKPVACEVWEGFIFISANPKESFRDYLGEIYDYFGGYFTRPCKRISRYRADVKVNWKVTIDAFVEGYHAPFLHGRAYPDQAAWDENYLAHLLTARVWDRHRMMSVEMNPDHRMSPIEQELVKYSEGVFTAMANIEKDWSKLPRGINPTRVQSWVFDAYVLFPNFYLAPMRQMHFVTYHFWPVSAERTIWQTEHYMFEPSSAGERLTQEFSKAFARDVQREDLITLENTQTMLKSGAMTHMPLSDQEVLCRHQYEVVDALVNAHSAQS